MVHTVPLDPIRALSQFAYWKLCLSILIKRRNRKRPVFTKDFACDCGWRHKWTMHEHLHWTEIHTLICTDCGDEHRVLGGGLVGTTKNPLNK